MGLYTTPPPDGFRVVRAKRFSAGLIDPASDDVADDLPRGSLRHSDLIRAKDALREALQHDRPLPREQGHVLLKALEDYAGRVQSQEDELARLREDVARTALVYFDEGFRPAASGRRATGEKDRALWQLFGRLDIRGKPRKKDTYDHPRLLEDWIRLRRGTGRVELVNPALEAAGLPGRCTVDGCPLPVGRALAGLVWWHSIASEYACVELLARAREAVRDRPEALFGVSLSAEQREAWLEAIGTLPTRKR